MNQPMKRQPKKRVPPKTNPKPAAIEQHAEKTEEELKQMKEMGKMKMQTHSPSRIGRDPDFVESVGLGTLRVITAKGIK